MNKMKSTLMGLILLVLLALAQSTPTYKSLTRYNYNEQFCEDTYDGRQLYIGEVFTRPGKCIRVQCLGTLQLWEDSCKTPLNLKGICVVLPATTNANLGYPRCCPMYECKKYESNSRGEMEQTNLYDHNGRLLQTHVNEVVVISKNPRSGSADILTGPVRKYEV